LVPFWTLAEKPWVWISATTHEIWDWHDDHLFDLCWVERLRTTAVYDYDDKVRHFVWPE